MDRRLRIVQHLFGELQDPADLEQLLQDGDVRAEYAALLCAKRALDARRDRNHQALRPDPATLDRLMAAAGRRRRVLLPARLPIRRVRRIGAATAALAACALFLLFQFGVIGTSPESSAPDVAASQAAPASVEEGASSAYTWDETEQLLGVHRRLSMVRARSSVLLWDESAVMSLDSLPTTPSQGLGGLEAASRRR